MLPHNPQPINLCEKTMSAREHPNVPVKRYQEGIGHRELSDKERQSGGIVCRGKIVDKKQVQRRGDSAADEGRHGLL